MPSYHVQLASVQFIFDDPLFEALCEECAEEAPRNPALGGTVPDRAIYDQLEAAGMIYPLAAVTDNGELAGFASVLLCASGHHAGKVVATTESLFVAKAHRKGGAGLALLNTAADFAKSVGAAGLYVTAPAGGPLGRILPRLGYTETNRIFLRSFNDVDEP